MSSKGSSRATTPSKTDVNGPIVADGFRCDVLEPNNIILADKPMREDQWLDLAFSLGIRGRAGRHWNNATSKLCQMMSKKKVYSATQTCDIFKPFLESLASDCPGLSQRDRCTYLADAVPTCETLQNTTRRLPTPTPAISVGYRRTAFSTAQEELQHGIIAGPMGEPYALDRVSQPVAGQYWPFFVVEFSDQSVEAAQQKNAVTTATLNNALTLLVGAATKGEPDGIPFSFDGKSARTFSLAIHNKTAYLSAHETGTSSAHMSAQISQYRLDSEDEVASLADRIQSILVWGQHGRLHEILAVLDELNRKVNGDHFAADMGNVQYDFDPRSLRAFKLQTPRWPDRVKVAFRAGLPSWLKA